MRNTEADALRSLSVNTSYPKVLF